MNLDKCNVTWHTPSDHSLGSMPLGNGDLGANVWATPDGRVHLLLSKTDAWDDNDRLVKLGGLTLESDDDLAAAIGDGFRHELKLAQARQEIAIGDPDTPLLRLRLWADANRPVLWLEVETPDGAAGPVHATLHTWRTEQRELSPGEAEAALKQDGEHERAVEYPDTMLEPPMCGTHDLGVCHRNTASPLPDLLRHQELEELIGEVDDPLVGRTFGCALRCVAGQARVKREPWSQTLTREPGGGRVVLALAAHTERTESLEAWARPLQRALDDAANAANAAIDDARRDHEAWWRAFWDRSFIDITGDAVADRITQVYQLQRYVTACAGRGAYPIKFNGSIFTMEGPPTKRPEWEQAVRFNADWRRWGGGYWFQNTRLIYWTLLAAGDTDMMRPWFDLFEAMAPLCQRRIEKHLGLGGLFFPETLTLWGTFRNDNYGYERDDDLNPALTQNRYIRRYWQGGLELSTIMLEHLAHTGDRAWFDQQAYPIIRDVVRFYHDYYDKRDEHGRVLMEPSQSLETWWDAKNPTPDIAGLSHVIDALLRLPSESVPAADRSWLEAFRDALPPIPVGPAASGEGDRILPAERYDERKNMENCSLYAVFPYPQGAVGGALHEQAKRAWPERRMKGVCGWFQDAVHAAMLGLPDEAADLLTAAWASDLADEEQARRLHTAQDPDIRFPGFFGPNFDWVPDQDHACVNAIALQKMLLQTQHGERRLLPAWPERWDVHFRLHAPAAGPTQPPATIEATARNGEVVEHTESPLH